MNIVEIVENSDSQSEQYVQNQTASELNLNNQSESLPIQTVDSNSDNSIIKEKPKETSSDNLVAAQIPEIDNENSAPDPSDENTTEVLIIEELANETSEADSAENQKSKWQQKLETIFSALKEKKDNKEPIDVFVKSRIRGGFRVIYKDIPLFLPASHYSLKRTPSEQELKAVVGTNIKVVVHELQDYEEGRKAVIVSRKQLLQDEFWDKIKVGDIVEGAVSSIASFGVFVDLGGVEGLIHISRLSQIHVEDPSKMMKKGDIIQAVVFDIDKDKNRIALSRKQLEDSPWKEVEQIYQVGTQHKGIVRRLTEFGVYVELKPGVDGLLRTPEISWTKRIRKPSDIFSPGQEITVEILNVSEEKQTVSLSYKKTTPNPWNQMIEKYPVGMELNGVVSQIMPQGAIISINDEVDGFMPRSKMKNVLKGKKIPYQMGENILVKIADLIPEEESLILAPVADLQIETPRETQKPKKTNQTQMVDNKFKTTSGGISLLDLLSDKDKKSIFNSVENK